MSSADPFAAIPGFGVNVPPQLIAPINSYMGLANPAPWAQYSNVPGIPQASMNPVQIAQISMMYNPVWGSQGAQVPFGGMGPLSAMIQGIAAPAFAKLIGMDPALMMSLPWQGTGGRSIYDFSRAIAMGKMETDMLYGRDSMAGLPPVTAFAGPSARYGPGIMGSVMRDFVNSDFQMAARVGMREFAPFMGGSLHSRALGVRGILGGLASEGSSLDGQFDKRRTSGVGIDDIMEGMGLASKFGISGFTPAEMLAGFGSTDPRARKRAFASRSFAPASS